MLYRGSHVQINCIDLGVIMKLIGLIILLILLNCSLAAQVITNYGFANSNSPYSELITGTVLGNETTTNQYFTDPATPLGNLNTTTGVGFPIGFSFFFNGHVFDRVGICTDGWISLGTSTYAPAVNMSSTNRVLPLSNTNTINPPFMITRVSALGIDLAAQAGSTLLITTDGIAPNRELVVQWKGYRKSAATGDNFNFQIRLQETTNLISINYDTMVNNATAALPQVGIRVEPATAATGFRTRSTTTNWMSTDEGTAATSTCTLSNTVYPVSGTMFAWTPPLPISGNFVIGAGGDFASFTLAFTYLNTIVLGNGIGPGGITFYVPAGSVFDENPPALNLSGFADRPIRFLKSEHGANPLIKATGTAATTDGIIVFNGADWCTFDGIDLANADGTTAIEYGYYLNATSYNGCENNTIVNGKVTLSATNTNTREIYSYGIYNAPNKQNSFTNLILENAATGIHLLGSASTPVSISYSQSESVTGCTFTDITSYGLYIGYGIDCVVSNNTINARISNSTSFYGIYFSAGSGSVLIHNNAINGSSSTASITGIYYIGGNGDIYDNTISGSASSIYAFVGINAANGNVNVLRNVIHSFTGWGSVIGIQVASACDLVNVNRNKIYDLNSTYTSSGYTTTGIIVGGTNCVVSNNFIYQLTCPGTALPKVMGINVNNGTNIYLWHNTVFLKSDTVSNGGTAALYISSENPTLDLQNNIFVNLYTPGTRSAAMWKTTAGFAKITATSNNNIYYAGTPGSTHLICYAGTNSYQTLTNYKAAISVTDQDSYTEDVPFVSITDPLDMHIDSTIATRVEGNALPIAGLTDDIDGEVRNITTPDIGADEGTFTSLGLLPNTANLIIPANNSIAQSPATILSWTAGLEGGIPTGYRIYMGTDGNGTVTPTNLYDGVDLGNILTYNPNPILQYLTTYYWKIVPYNAVGDAANCPIWAFGTHDIPLTGVKTIGSTGYYPDFDVAIRHLNAAGVGSGGVIFDVAAGETFAGNPVPITASGSIANPILFRTDGASATHPIIRATGGTGSYGIKIEGGDYITFEGIDIANVGSATSLLKGYWIAGVTGNSASNLEIRNCNITLSRAVTSYGISSETVTGALNNNLTIHNNLIDNTTNAIYIAGISGTQNISIGSNTITNAINGIYVNYGVTCNIFSNTIAFPLNATVAVVGIYVSNLTDGLIYNNTVSGGHTTNTITGLYAYSGSSFWYGNIVTNLSANSTLNGWSHFTGTHSVYNNEIYALSSVGSVSGLNLSPASSYSSTLTIYNNKIHDLTSTTTGSGLACGIYGYGYGVDRIYNNYIYDLKNTGGSTVPQVRGISFESSSQAKEIYFNTVYLNAGGTNANYSTAALHINITGSVRLNNNILINRSTHGSTGRTVAWWKASAGFDNMHVDSDNNIYYAGTPDATHLICYNSTTAYTSIDAYKTANPGKDQGSFADNIPFMSTSAPYDLHINPALPTRSESNGEPIAGITTDFDGELRDAVTPDIGADEGVFTPVVELPVPAVAYYPTNAEIVVPLLATLSWFPGSGGGNVSGYRLSIGTDNPPTNVVNGVSIGDVLTYTVSQSLNYLTTYYWQIVPYNSQGDAQNCPVWDFETLDVPMTGIRTVGSGGRYPNFTVAIRHLNADGVGAGGITFNVAAGEVFTETPPIITSTGTLANPVVFQSSNPALANPLLIAAGGTNTYGFRLKGVDYFTFDRIDVSRSAAATNLTCGYWIEGITGNGAIYNTIRNCHITLSRTNTASIGIYSNGSSNGANNYATINNNTIDDVYTGISFGNGAQTIAAIVQNNILTNVSAYGIILYYNTNSLIQGNQIAMAAGNNVAFYGIHSYSSSNTGSYNSNIITGATTSSSFCGIYTWYGNVQVNGNEIRSFSSTGNSLSYGMYFTYGNVSASNNHIHALSCNGSVTGISRYSSTSTILTANRIHDITSTGSSTQIVTGLQINAPTCTISNNMIYDIRNPGGNTVPQVRGMYISSGSTNQILYNSVLLNTSGTYANFSTAALYLESGTANVLKNNIFTNLSTPGATGRTVAFWNTLAAFTNVSTDANNNIYYAGVPGAQNLIGYNLSTPYQQISDYLAAISDRDQGSFSEAVPFVSVTDPVDLHIRTDAPTRVENSGLLVTAVTTDFDGESRSVNTPDIGADEGSFTPVPGPPGSPNVISPAHQAVNVALTSALTWIQGTGGLPDQYEVYFGTTNPPAYVTTVVAALYNPVLLPQTTYYWQIKAINAYGNTSGPVWNFLTRDDFTIYEVPFNEGFETGNTQGSTTVNHWTQQLQTNTQYWTVNSTNLTNNRAPRTGAFDLTLATNANCWIFRPMQMDSNMTYEINVWVRQNTSTLSQASLQISYGASPAYASMTTVVMATTNIANGDYQKLVGIFTPATSGLFYLGIQGIVSGSSNYLSLDDFSIVERVPLPIFSITPDNWYFGRLEVGSSGLAKDFIITNNGDGDLIIDPANVNIIGAGAPSYILTPVNDLIVIPAGQTHTIYITFAPLAIDVQEAELQITDNMLTRDTHNIPLTGRGIGPLVLPFVMDFELSWDDWVVVNGTQANQWQVGNLDYFGGLYSAYISNNGGSTIGYAAGTASVTHFYHDIQFPADMSNVHLIFDWKAMGELDTDYLSVHLVDLSVHPVAGETLTTGMLGTICQGESSWQSTRINLNPTLAGQVKRLVFSWTNDGSGGSELPACLDKIRILNTAIIPGIPTQISAQPVNDQNIVITCDPAANANEYILEDSDMFDGTFSYFARSGNPQFILPAAYQRRFFRIRAGE